MTVLGFFAYDQLILIAYGIFFPPAISDGPSDTVRTNINSGQTITPSTKTPPPLTASNTVVTRPTTSTLTKTNTPRGSDALASFTAAAIIVLLALMIGLNSLAIWLRKKFEVRW
jgi:hypothetical protein